MRGEASRTPLSSRVADAVFGFLLHPRVRKVRQWAGFVTVPLFVVFLYLFGLERGAALVALELALVAVVVLLFFRLERERREAVLDLVFPPLERRLLRAEAAVLATYVRLLRRDRRSGAREWTYHRGSTEFAVAIALAPAIAAELLVVHLLVPWFWAKVAVTAVSVYGYVWLVGWVMSMRVYPHRLGDGALALRLGALYRADVPVTSIARIAERRETVDRGSRVVVREGKAFFLADGRVDVHLDLASPAVVNRPLGEPVSVQSLAVAADDARGMVAEISKRLETRGAPPPGVG